MRGKVTKHRKGVNIITGEDGCTYYNYGLPLRVGTEVAFTEDSFDDEVADDVRPAFPTSGFSLRDNIISAIIGILIGAVVALMAVKPVHAEPISEHDKALLIQIVHAEAGNQDLLGRRLVADVVLNRVEHEDFPDTVSGVIYQPGQFQPVANGSLHLKADDMDALAVELELSQRTNDTVLFFRRGRYADYGEPHFKVGDHFFS